MTDSFLICLDPISYQIYSIGLSTRLLVLELEAPYQIREKALNTIKELKELQTTDGIFWWFESPRYHQFQKRIIPNYLLQPDCHSFPRHLQSFDLGNAFNKQSTIEMNIELTYYSQLKNEGMKTTCPEVLRLSAPLITGADGIIIKCVRQIYREHKIKLTPLKEGNRLALKVSGAFEFLYGDVALINYKRVRALLRDSQLLKVKLTEMPNKLYTQTYPPLVQRKISDVLSNKFKRIPWAKFIDQPLLVWHPPVELSENPSKKEGWISKHVPYNNEEKILEYPRACFYYTMNEFMNQRRQDAVKNVVLVGNSAACYSGELNFPFKVKIQGLENFEVLVDRNKNQLLRVDGSSAQKQNLREFDVAEPSDQQKKEEGTYLVPRLAKPGRSLSSAQQEETIKAQKFHMNQGSGTGSSFLLSKSYDPIPFSPFMISVEVLIFSGNKLLDRQFIRETVPKPFNMFPRWSEWLTFSGLTISCLPLETKLFFNVKIYSQKWDYKVIGSTSFHLFDVFGKMKTNLVEINLWPTSRLNPDFVCAEDFWGLSDSSNLKSSSRATRSNNFARLVIQLESFALPVHWSLRTYEIRKLSLEAEEQKMLSESQLLKKKSQSPPSKNPPVNPNQIKPSLVHQTPTTEELAMLQILLQRDGITQEFNEKEKEIIFKCRHHYKSLTKGLAIFLLSVNWSRIDLAVEAYRMLQDWELVKPEEALSLLNPRYGNESVRAYAVERISEMPDEDLALYMPQLVMALAYEPSHFSFLGEFLLERALANPYIVGNQFYWQLKSQLHVRTSHERYYIYLEQFIRLAGSYRQELLAQVRVNRSLTQISLGVKSIVGKNQMTDYVRTSLENLNGSLKNSGSLPSVSLPLDTRMRGSEFVVELCTVKDSKNLPLWLSMRSNEDEATNIGVMFEIEPYFRQQQVILEIIVLMDKLWLENGLDLCIKSYQAMPIAAAMGMVEIVRKATSLDSIKRLENLSTTSNSNFIKEYLDPTSKDRAIKNFIGSTAGYCVAIYILGIEDRTGDDMMITKEGYFSIVNFKRFLGYTSNRANKNPKKDKPLFSQIIDIAQFVIGDSSDTSKLFVDSCVKGYRIIRKHENFIISLLTTLISAGMEDITFDSIRNLQERLAVNLTNEDAIIKFREEISSHIVVSNPKANKKKDSAATKKKE